jgi:hypothetical protein
MASNRLADGFKWWRSPPPAIGKTDWSEFRWDVRLPDAEVFASKAALKLQEDGFIVLGIDARSHVAASKPADDIFAVAQSRNIHPVILTSGNPLDWVLYGFDVEFIPDGPSGNSYLSQVLALWGAAGAVPLDQLLSTARLLPSGKLPAQRS